MPNFLVHIIVSYMICMYPHLESEKRKKMKMIKIVHVSFYVCLFVFISFNKSNAQTSTITTDPSEVRALNSLLEQWEAPAQIGLWNISGDPCTGTAVNQTELEDRNNNPSIKCSCSTSDNRTTCHITHLRVYALNKRGVIPQELAALSFLTFLKIDQNYFTGELPAFIGNLTALQLLSVAHNAFSGPIPRELGNLRQLTMLSFGSNNFSGTLPPELGNLVRLDQIYMNSCGAGGEIPSTFSRLRNMRIMWASDSPFTGNIPDFIQNWTMLTSLRFQGNSFEGPIPSGFSSLTSLTSLRISDLHNVSSSLDFITELRNLTDLVLRNALISGRIPPEIGEHQRLQALDLSFNNLTGRIPSTLFTLSSLTSLFLGNNSLSGSLPSQKSEGLQNIDLSYNELSGSFPSWVTRNLQLNLVANNFAFDGSNITVLPGLHCLQRSFPCNRNSPRYANFSIKCGGPEMRANGIVYEAENSTAFGPAWYNVTSTEKWAVSNVGVFSDRSDATYSENTLAQVLETMTPELYQTSRVSPGSLRYYGLGLENGDYNISLFFAETVFNDRRTRTWESLGRRVFDIYIQGSLRQKDFDISHEAGGVEIAVQKVFNATVTQNYLEIHLFWAGKGTCCIPTQGDYGPMLAALNVVSEFVPTVSGIPETFRSNKSRTPLIVGIAVSVGAVSLLVLIAVLYLKRKDPYADEEEVLLGIGPKPNTFSYAEIRTATEDFNPSNKLGEGGYGPVYKGTLYDGRLVAVKQLSVASHQGKSQFVTEISTISAVQHWNLVKLYGCCFEGNRRILVYEYLENKSLDQALFGKNDLHLDWPTRFAILSGTARGLAYLHEESRPKIVHRDVKASNILLDKELCPKISDFGLAKLYDDKETHISTRVAGTIGYLAPEYAMRGHLTEKADVFGFGVVCLEVLSGRMNTDDSLDSQKKYLLEWAWNLHENNRSLELVDPSLKVFDEQEAVLVLRLALLCTQASPSLRPFMSRVVAMLSGDMEVSTTTTKPSYLTDWDFDDLSNAIMDDDDEIPLAVVSQNSKRQVEDTSVTNTGVDDVIHTPINITEPMLLNSIAEGR